jgi:hypothetical protein
MAISLLASVPTAGGTLSQVLNLSFIRCAKLASRTVAKAEPFDRIKHPRGNRFDGPEARQTSNEQMLAARPPESSIFSHLWPYFSYLWVRRVDHSAPPLPFPCKNANG